jgi:glycylpeptide N-tetradecanoyltransferase
MVLVKTYAQRRVFIPSFRALLPPGWDAQWHIGIRDENTELVAFISCSPCSLRARSNTLRAVDVNFLCVSKAHRSRRWAPLLIQEITRRANLAGIFQAIYTAGVSLPEPIAAANYYHRPLNNRKLIEAGFSFLPAGKSVDQMESFFKLPESVNLPRFRELGKSDIPAAKALLAQYSVKFGLAQVFDEQEFEHWFLPREKVVYSFVRFDESNEMDGFVSFYSIPTSILEPKASGHGIIEAAYLYYYAVKPDTEEHSLIPLIKAALIEAKRRGFDVVNCVEIMDGAVFLDSLKFGEGDGCLRYYLFNWRTKRMAPGDVAFVML